MVLSGVQNYKGESPLSTPKKTAAYTKKTKNAKDYGG
jgi:hypothetical protein